MNTALKPTPRTLGPCFHTSAPLLSAFEVTQHLGFQRRGGSYGQLAMAASGVFWPDFSPLFISKAKSTSLFLSLLPFWSVTGYKWKQQGRSRLYFQSSLKVIQTQRLNSPHGCPSKAGRIKLPFVLTTAAAEPVSHPQQPIYGPSKATKRRWLCSPWLCLAGLPRHVPGPTAPPVEPPDCMSSGGPLWCLLSARVSWLCSQHHCLHFYSSRAGERKRASKCSPYVSLLAQNFSSERLGRGGTRHRQLGGLISLIMLVSYRYVFITHLHEARNRRQSR